jgi:hypothetical protein
MMIRWAGSWHVELTFAEFFTLLPGIRGFLSFHGYLGDTRSLYIAPWLFLYVAILEFYLLARSW